MVDVEQRRLRALEEDVSAAAHRFVDFEEGVAEHRRHAAAPGERLFVYFVEVERLCAVDFREYVVFDFERARELVAQHVGVDEVFGADAYALVLVGVAGADAAARRAYLRSLGARALGELVYDFMVGHDYVRRVADDELRRFFAARREAVELFEERVGVDDDAVADHAALARVEYAGGQQMKDVFLVVHDDGVSGVGSALVADDHSGVRGEDVYDAALAFVAPLHSYDYVSASLHCDTPL